MELNLLNNTAYKKYFCLLAQIVGAFLGYVGSLNLKMYSVLLNWLEF